MNSEPTKHKFYDIYIERYIMKLRSLVNENTNSKIRLLITESQFKNLANKYLRFSFIQYLIIYLENGGISK